MPKYPYEYLDKETYEKNIEERDSFIDAFAKEHF